MEPPGLSARLMCVMTILSLQVTAVSSKHADCFEPSDLTIQALYKNLREGNFSHSSVNQHHPTRNSSAHIIPINGKSPVKLHKAVCECHSKDEINFDPRRIPKAIPQSPCDKINQQKFGRYQAECRDVLEDIFVYRRTDQCVDNTYEYRLHKERIKVGCSCHLSVPVLSQP